MRPPADPGRFAAEGGEWRLADFPSRRSRRATPRPARSLGSGPLSNVNTPRLRPAFGTTGPPGRSCRSTWFGSAMTGVAPDPAIAEDFRLRSRAGPASSIFQPPAGDRTGRHRTEERRPRLRDRRHAEEPAGVVWSDLVWVRARDVTNRPISDPPGPLARRHRSDLDSQSRMPILDRSSSAPSAGPIPARSRPDPFPVIRAPLARNRHPARRRQIPPRGLRGSPRGPFVPALAALAFGGSGSDCDSGGATEGTRPRRISPALSRAAESRGNGRRAADSGHMGEEFGARGRVSGAARRRGRGRCGRWDPGR